MLSNTKKKTKSCQMGKIYSQKLNANFIKNSISPTDFYRHELPAASLKKNGWNIGGLCPFHSDRTAGSFFVNVTTGQFKCFACETSGADVIAFVMALNGLQFFEAMSILADDWRLV